MYSLGLKMVTLVYPFSSEIHLRYDTSSFTYFNDCFSEIFKCGLAHTS